ncbi:MAG: PIN domain-containing protein [Burkholderiales bacterium]
MPSKPFPIFLDTSAIRQAGLNDSDSKKLLNYSRSDDVQLFVSYIAWEELRTEFLRSAWSEISTLHRQFAAVRRKYTESMVLQGLRSPEMNVWGEAEVTARSREAMAEFARDNRITVVHMGADHPDRAWCRYFEVNLPFNREVTDREKRRKDIPDSWILEAAIDVKRDHPSLVAVCTDVNLAKALEAVLEIRVFKTVEDVVANIESRDETAKTGKRIEVRDSAYVPPKEGPAKADTALTAAFTEPESRLRTVGTKIIGLVSYLRSVTKDQLYAILEESGIPTDESQNIASQLVRAKIIVDTGNNYIPGNKEAGAEARAAAEPEIIRLVKGEG